MLFKIKGKKENHVKEKKKALNKEDKWNIGSSHIKLSERIRMDFIQSIKVSSDNFQGWGEEEAAENKNNMTIFRVVERKGGGRKQK